MCLVLNTEGKVPQWSCTMLFRRKIKVDNDACFICKMNIFYNSCSNINFMFLEKKKLFCKILKTILTVTDQLVCPIVWQFYLPQWKSRIERDNIDQNLVLRNCRISFSSDCEYFCLLQLFFAREILHTLSFTFFFCCWQLPKIPFSIDLSSLFFYNE